MTGIGAEGLQNYGPEMVARLIAEFSTYHLHGGLFIDDEETPSSVVVSLPTAGSPVVATGWVAGRSTGAGYIVVDAANGTITIGDKGGGIYRGRCGISFGSSRANVVIHGYLTLNGSKITTVSWRRDIGNANQIGNANAEFPIPDALVPGDVIRFVLESDTNTTTVTADHGGFYIERIGGE